MYARRPTAAELEAIGLLPEDMEGEFDAICCTENWDSARAFEAMRTQWRVGPGGPYGLDYTALRTSVLPFLEIPRSKWPRIFADVIVMEDEALVTMHEEKDQKNGQ